LSRKGIKSVLEGGEEELDWIIAHASPVQNWERDAAASTAMKKKSDIPEGKGYTRQTAKEFGKRDGRFSTEIVSSTKRPWRPRRTR